MNSPIKKIAIIGTGVIGAGWTIRLLAKNKIVNVYDPNNSQINSIKIPTELNRPLPKFDISTQDYLQMILTEILRSNHSLSERIVTTSPDVATSTSLAGWIANKNGLLWDDYQKEDKKDKKRQNNN